MPRREGAAVLPRVLPFDLVFLVGLAGVFLVNAVVAVVHPEDFTGLLSRSALARWAHLDRATWLVPLITVNDLLLGLAVLAVMWRARGRSLVLAWSGGWLLLVTLVKLSAVAA
jgi:hypothetical protein